MAEYTSNYNLEKPAETEFYDVAVQNGNMDKIDETIASIDAAKADAKSTLADGDAVSIVDSADSSKTKRVLWSTFKSALGQLFVPLTRKINNKALSSDLNLTGEDIPTSSTDETSISSQLSNLQSTVTTPPQEFDLPLADGFSGTAKYSKNQFGQILLTIDITGSYSNATVIGTLPAGFRPSETVTVLARISGEFSTIDIDSTGKVRSFNISGPAIGAAFAQALFNAAS